MTKPWDHSIATRLSAEGAAFVGFWFEELRCVRFHWLCVAASSQRNTSMFVFECEMLIPMNITQ